MRLRRWMPSGSRVAIGLLVCTNILTVLTLYSNIPGLGSPAASLEDPSSQALQLSSSRRFEKGHGLQGFILYSSYRVSLSSFVALGLSALALHNLLKADTCSWRMSNGTEVLGNVTITSPGDAHKRAYEVSILLCTLVHEVTGPVGGRLFMTIDREEVAMYGEAAGTNPRTELERPKFSSNLTYCGSPMYGRIDAERLKEWLEYHRITHAVDFFHMYDAGGVDNAVRARLQPYVKAGHMAITDMREINQFETWLYAQLLVLNDCAYRSRFTAKWALFMDLDEFLFVTKPPNSIQPILAASEGTMWLTFGSKFFYTDKCTPTSLVPRGSAPPWSIERMVFRQFEVHCKNVPKYGNRSLCLEYDGHRKYIVDPRQISVCGIHKVVYPKEGGMHLRTEDVHLNHFRALNTPQVSPCAQFINDSSWIPQAWARDFSLARAATAARMQQELQKLTGAYYGV